MTIHEEKKQVISHFTRKKYYICQSIKYPFSPSNLWSISTITKKQIDKLKVFRISYLIKFLNLFFNNFINLTKKLSLIARDITKFLLFKVLYSSKPSHSFHRPTWTFFLFMIAERGLNLGTRTKGKRREHAYDQCSMVLCHSKSDAILNLIWILLDIE